MKKRAVAFLMRKYRKEEKEHSNMTARIHSSNGQIVMATVKAMFQTLVKIDCWGWCMQCKQPLKLIDLAYIVPAEEKFLRTAKE